MTSPLAVSRSHFATLALSLGWPTALLAQPPAVQPKGPQIPAGVKVIRDQEYARVGEKRLLLDLYLPEQSPAPLPVIVGIHGGGWAAGSKQGAPGIGLSGRGYAVACIAYRLSGEAIFPAQIEDCKAAVRWLRANAQNYNLDANHIGAIGHSAGGHLSSLLGTSGDVQEFEKGENLDKSSRVQAVCAMSGPTDLLQMDAHALPSAPFKHDAPQSPESRLIGGAIQQNQDKAARANPITYITNVDPPFLLVHGEQDPLVPPHQATLLHEALQKSGIESTLRVIPGAGHGVGGPEVNRAVEAFFAKHLKTPPPREAAPAAKP
jgi:acetyl esterase/lipase